MNIRKLETFILLVDKQSFSEVAEMLHCTQPAVSRQMKSLEKDLNIVLIDRTSHGIRPTPAGSFLYQRAKEMIQDWKSIEADIRSFQDTLSGNVIIGTSTIPGTYLMPRWIRHFRLTYPNIAVSVEIGDSEQMIEKLENEQSDIAIVGAKPNSSEVHSYEVASDTLVMIAPTDHPVCSIHTSDLLKALKEYEFVLREEGSGTRKVMEEYLATQNLEWRKLNTVLHVGSTEAVISAVEEGLGLSFVSKLAAVPAEKAGRIQIIEAFNAMKRKFYMSVLKRRESHPIIQAFTSHLPEMNKK